MAVKNFQFSVFILNQLPIVVIDLHLCNQFHSVIFVTIITILLIILERWRGYNIVQSN